MAPPPTSANLTTDGAPGNEETGSDPDASVSSSTTPSIPPQSAQRRIARKARIQNAAPQHPIPSMQGAFEESLVEATNPDAAERPKLRVGNAKHRRELLIRQDDGGRELENDFVIWRRRPGQKHHEFWKLVAQISFGVYLLLTGQANDEHQVVGILQGHIDDIDEFLEVMLEDIDYAIDDFTDRMALLRLPLQNMHVFDRMLDDPDFWLQIVTGNEKIEKIIALTRRVLDGMLSDVEQGFGAADAFRAYLTTQEQGSWRTSRPWVVDMFDAMNGNTKGWLNALSELQAKCGTLESLIKELTEIVDIIDTKAEEANDRSRQSEKRQSQNAPSVIDEVEDADTSAVVLSASQFKLSEAESQVSKPDESPRLAVDDSTQWLSAGNERADNSGGDDGALFLLQPRTYTPQPPAPVPSPMSSSHPQRSLSSSQDEESHPISRQQQSLPDGASVRSNAIQSVRTPSLGTFRSQQPAPGHHRLSSRQGIPIMLSDSTYDLSSLEVRAVPFSPATVADHHGQASPPPASYMHRAMIASPRSEQHNLYASPLSPYSPRPQRPWTSGDLAENLPNGIMGHNNHNRPPQFPQFPQSPQSPLHNQPYLQHSANGVSGTPRQAVPHVSSPLNMRMVSAAASVSDLRSIKDSSASTAPDGKIKKKRSAFGWLKKAFVLDEEERAIFEARKHQPIHNPYAEGRSTRYLDGRRVR